MKALLLTSLLLLIVFRSSAQNCMSIFSYGANFETVIFYNQSFVSNAHYWWNFGDGTGSNYQNPVHVYPESGKYLVTLFAKDTINNCSDYYELWMDITKYSIDPCSPSINDSVFNDAGTDYMKIIDNSSNCSGYIPGYDAGPASNYSSVSNWIYLDSAWGHARFLSRVEYYDTNIVLQLKRSAYKSTLFNYSSENNYNDCSANFEYTVIEEDANGQRILFSAMNKNVNYYQWEIIGFGNPIWSYDDTVSYWYDFNNQDRHLIGLKIESSSGCKDTVYQQILIRSTVNTTVGIEELEGTFDKEKELIKIIDLTGRETEDKPNTLLIYIFSDGTTEKVLRFE